MRLDKLLVYLETSPAMRLLRSSNAAYILDFLYTQFKTSDRITMLMSELHAALADYQDRLHETHPTAMTDKPDVYLSTWCAGDTRWLHRFLEAGRNEPIYQLTPHTEDVFAFLDRVLQQDLGFVGTESRLRLIITTLADLTAGASDDPEVRLAHLREERTRIDDEIIKVEREGLAARYEPAVIRERFATAVSLLRQLLGDFRAVEDRFKEITKEVQQRQIEGKDSLGNILQFALDSEDLLKHDDQGVSFHEFVRFILSPTQQEKLQAIITQLGHINDLAQQQEGLMTVRRMVPSLLAEAEKVMRTNQRLTTTLRRLLDARSASERKRLALLLQEIRRLAATLSANPPATVGTEVDIGIAISSPFSRTFWSQPAQFASVDLTENHVDEQQRIQMFHLLAQMHRLNWKVMRDKVRRLVNRNGSVTLRQIIEEFPPTAGIIELLGYLQIAQDDGHLISKDESEEIILCSNISSQRGYKVMVPLVFFMPKDRSA
jgi:hypothetical protein